MNGFSQLRCGLLGERLGHSLSPVIHALLADYSYRLFERAPGEVEEFLRTGAYDAINVTIPYKKTAFACCDEVSDEARRLGNVNVVVRRGGRLYGDNTDAHGFRRLLAEVGVDIAALAGETCIVLGSGGAGTTVRCVLEAAGARVVTVSRTGEDNYGNLARHDRARLLVNATPVGMFPHGEAMPVDPAALPGLRAVCDLVYNPSPTRLVRRARELGLAAADGMTMLLAQARRAAEIFTGGLLAENLYLYGPPGSGKSTLARRLAFAFERPLVDLDAEIVAEAGRPIAEQFAGEGEAAFRAREKAVLGRVASRSGQVVALGGGALLDPESRALCERTGRVFVLDCDEAELLRRVSRSAERPLLAGDARAKLARLLDARRAHYASFPLHARI